MSDAELAQKFRHNAERFLATPVIAELVERVLHLEHVEDVSQLARLW